MAWTRASIIEQILTKFSSLLGKFSKFCTVKDTATVKATATAMATASNDR